VAELKNTIEYQLSEASDILIKWPCGTNNRGRATGADKNQFNISTPFMRKADGHVDIFQRLKNVARQHRIRHFSNKANTNMRELLTEMAGLFNLKYVQHEIRI